MQVFKHRKTLRVKGLEKLNAQIAHSLVYKHTLENSLQFVKITNFQVWNFLSLDLAIIMFRDDKAFQLFLVMLLKKF